MIHRSTSPRRWLAWAAAATVGLVGVLAGPAAPALAYADYEAESTLSIDSAYGSPYADPDASGGQALAIWNNATATGSLTAPHAFHTIEVRMMGGACGSTDASPRARITVDGVTAGETSVGTAWYPYRFTGSWQGGAHTIGVTFLNEYGDGTCDRFLEVDRFRITSMPQSKHAALTGTVASPATVVDLTAAVQSKAVRLVGTGSVTVPFTTAERFDEVKVRFRGFRCDGAPTVNFVLDGAVVGSGTYDYNSTAWYPGSALHPAHGQGGKWAAGDHTLKLQLANPYSSASCTRLMYVDVVGLHQSAAYTETPYTPPASGFITRDGTRLMLDGKPFQYAGLNAFGMSGCDQADGQPWTDAELDSYFGKLAPNTVTRTWAFRNGGLPVLDRIVASAAKHRQKVLFTLADGRNYCGEYDGSSNPGTEGVDKTLAWYQGGFRTDYLPWVREVTDRFKADATVAFWEIINEPGSQENTAYTDAIVKAFLDETAAVIKGIDPNHLISSGTVSQDYRGSRDFSYVHSGPDIDLGSLHEYEYDWFNPDKNAYENSITYNNLGTLLAEMQQVNKPLIIGETGVYAADAPGCRTSLASRAGVIRQKLDAYLGQPGVAGVNVWSVVNGDPIREGEPCPLEGTLNDPMIAQVAAKQAALNNG
ncbi:carbohydrate-binding domain-containing protein [Actinoplanes sp. NPDC023714]|uniref:carbohydrate-binding domain-containing protein n=1 Tax=Actinoplanes sp. NPDC023714 TaxID=3154322 RepID=UPI0034069026